MSDEHLFGVHATWSPVTREGTLANDGGTATLSHAGAVALGGKGGAVNPEELLLFAVSACFSQTWAIFLAKLRVQIDAPVVEATCTVDKDPAGGFRVTRIELAPHVPAALWAERRADLEKTLQLAEKYCIVSKAVREGKELRVTPRLV